MAHGDLLVVGTGSLARAVCDSYAVCADVPGSVTVVGRDPAAAQELALLAAARTAIAGGPVAWHGRRADLGDATQLAELIGGTDPDIVVQCASLQSPWESRTEPSPWTALVARAGLGVTLPLQARLAAVTATAIGLAGGRARFINACFPDGVNPALVAAGVPVWCGIGNVATLAAGLAAALRGQRRGVRPAAPGARLRVLAHHVHLHPPDRAEDELSAWLDDAPVADVGRLLAGHRRADRERLNAVTGFAAARLLADLLAGREVATSLPGPLGLPGGYPVRIRAGVLALDLPTGLTRDQAVAVNRRAGERDGIRLADGYLRFPDSAAAELGRYAPDLAAGVPLDRLADAADQLVELRSQLRNAREPGAGQSA